MSVWPLLTIKEAFDELGAFGFAAQRGRNHAPCRLATGELTEVTEVLRLGQPRGVDLVALRQLQGDILDCTVVGGGHHHFEAEQLRHQPVGCTLAATVIGRFATVLDEGIRGPVERRQYIGALSHHGGNQVAQQGSFAGARRAIDAQYTGGVRQCLQDAVDRHLLRVHQTQVPFRGPAAGA